MAWLGRLREAPCSSAAHPLIPVPYNNNTPNTYAVRIPTRACARGGERLQRFLEHPGSGPLGPFGSCSRLTLSYHCMSIGPSAWEGFRLAPSSWDRKAAIRIVICVVIVSALSSRYTHGIYHRVPSMGSPGAMGSHRERHKPPISLTREPGSFCTERSIRALRVVPPVTVHYRLVSDPTGALSVPCCHEVGGCWSLTAPCPDGLPWTPPRMAPSLQCLCLTRLERTRDVPGACLRYGWPCHVRRTALGEHCDRGESLREA